MPGSRGRNSRSSWLVEVMVFDEKEAMLVHRRRIGLLLLLLLLRVGLSRSAEIPAQSDESGRLIAIAVRRSVPSWRGTKCWTMPKITGGKSKSSRQIEGILPSFFFWGG